MKKQIKSLVIVGVLAIVGVNFGVSELAWAVCKCTGSGGSQVCKDDVTGATCAPSPAGASNLTLSGGITDAKTDDMAGGDLTTIIGNIVKIFMYAVGAVSVIMMIFGGFQYVTSSGDQAKVTKAKNTILYGIVGLAIAILASAIINFVINNVK